MEQLQAEDRVEGGVWEGFCASVERGGSQVGKADKSQRQQVLEVHDGGRARMMQTQGGLQIPWGR